MPWNATLYLLPLILASAICIALSIVSWRRRSVPGARSFSLLMFTGASWTLAYALELLSNHPQNNSPIYSGFQLAFAAYLSPFFGLFILQYTRQSWVSTRVFFTVFAIPILTGGLALGLISCGVLELECGHSETLFPLTKAFRTWYWIDKVYAIGLMISVELLLVREAMEAPRLYRQQAIVLLLGGMIPLTSAIVPAFFQPSPSQTGLLPFSYMVAGSGIVWGFIQYRMLDIVPAARDLVVESMTDLVLVLDIQNRVIDMNPAAERTFGCNADEATGRPVESIFQEASALQGHPHEEIDAQAEIVLCEGEQPHFFDLRISPLYGWRHLLAGWLIVLRDVTDRKLYEKELIAAKEQAETAVQIKSTLLHNVSHEIRTPLASIIGFAHIAAEEVPPEQKEFLEIIELNGHRLLNTLNNILDLAQLKSRGLPVRLDTFDAGTEVRDTVRLMESMTRLKGIGLRLDIPEEHLDCYTDRSFLSRIVTNLTSNAIKFTEKGHILVHLRCNDDELILSVQDTGIGISEAFMPHLFEEFRQERFGSEGNYVGNGLGLSITRQLIEQLGGRIEVDSSRNRGTTFSVYLPRYAASTACIPQPIVV